MVSIVIIELQWKEHRVDLRALEAWLRENAGEEYRGNCTDDHKLSLAFASEPGEEIREAIADLWEELEDEEHEMCASYASQEELDEEEASALAAAKASAQGKLAALGLTEAEIAAILR